MAKTRSNRRTLHHNKTRHQDTFVGECCDATFHGLHDWHKRMFEELGWMILAKNRGMIDKTNVYKAGIARLKHALEQKIKSTREKDRKDDLHILHHNVCILMEHAEKDL